MTGISLALKPRQVFGNKNKLIRAQGLTPVHIFGHGLKSLALQADTLELESTINRAGSSHLVNIKLDTDKKTRKVFIREIQRNPIKGYLEHVDFYQINLKEKVTAEIPIHFSGESSLLKEKGHKLIAPFTHLTVEALPDDLPPEIHIDLSQFDTLEKDLYIKDIILPGGAKILNEADLLVAKVSEVHLKVETTVAVNPAEESGEKPVAHIEEKESTEKE
ncbi:50S ribosomal protein L25/general stress protein Ctc [Dehalococcoides mccartyi]|uniref:Large ribosomal subunit protein bL25 n=2 Tax=Dehalococcoides mccartyi TaxID=61435 RepID=RL25_DEHMC|nr:50S ribosomal protein L25/general stress protein Ctc [Dehalococcoides mccartyi]A5FPN6.1 RecName: Full=Large ribosomal subunit protein bL25; AltName: Full=50S ribosomal protein L25; AltName: Full=General stress protein CTC [Dehalococcoides mccartyi BAV1]Q3ZYZ2.1 RecName: Full=Large ribosomal subunit protein bL25; AltName: Full=50S ribosomal protein L25; AltName: Full=General stress protein CTC [Dehalococcoides mccartyi CBDB1]AQX73693.1 50S ribosomal protein L25/general stress protein Ctc [Deha